MSRRLYPRDATDEQIAVMILAQLLSVSDVEAARIFAEEEADTPIGRHKRKTDSQAAPQSRRTR